MNTHTVSAEVSYRVDSAPVKQESVQSDEGERYRDTPFIQNEIEAGDSVK